MITDVERWTGLRAAAAPGVDGVPIGASHDAWLARFVARVAIVHDGTSCWLWTGSRVPKGYGQFSPRWKTKVYAHRLSWELASGVLAPRDLLVLHSCDNPPCVRPDHLSLGTHARNMQEMVARGRDPKNAPHGERNPFAKLTDEKVRALRADFAAGTSFAELGRRYSVSSTVAADVARWRRWKHVAAA